MLAKAKIAGLMVALMALSVGMVYADNGSTMFTTGGGGGKDSGQQAGEWHHGRHQHMMGEILNLSADQIKQLKDIKEKQKAAKKSIFEQMKANRKAFEAEIVKAAPDMGKINDIQAQLKTIQSQMVDNHLKFILDIKKLLTPAQFAGYMALEREEDMMKHDGHHKFGHKEGTDKPGDSHKYWGNKGDKDQDND